MCYSVSAVAKLNTHGCGAGMVLYEAIGLLILLALSGVFSGSETALVALSHARAEALRAEGRSGARALLRLKDKLV